MDHLHMGDRNGVSRRESNLIAAPTQFGGDSRLSSLMGLVS